MNLQERNHLGYKHPNMNLDKKKVSCLVPLCVADWCNAERKKTCALRRYFLCFQKELRETIPFCLPEYHQYIYYYRRENEKKIETES